MSIALDNWIEGMVPGKWHIMGIEMQELTYGHMVLMERMMCYPIKSYEDVAHCILICSKKYKESCDYIYYWKTKYLDLVKELIGHIVKDPSKWATSCIDYFESHTKMMQTMQKVEGDKPKRQLGSPFLAMIRVVAITKLGYNPQTIHNAPFAPLLMDIQVNAELEGRSSISGGSAAADAIESLKQRMNNVSK